METTKTNEDYSFTSWLFSRQEIIEKTVGIAVIGIEVYNNLGHLFPAEEYRITFTHFLNLGFLVFIYFFLRNDFNKRFYVNPDNPEVAKIIGLSRYSEEHKQKKIRELIFNANTFVSQLKNINYFFLATASLYALFILQTYFFSLNKNEFCIDFIHTHFPHIQLWKFKEPLTRAFHLFSDLLSYAGAFYLLKCFYVMYLPTIDEQGNDILNRKTFGYVLLGVAFMVFDYFIVLPKPISPSSDVTATVSTINTNGLFIAEFVCGLVNSVVFILFIARFENKLLDIPPFILAILYIYAIIQTCLLFVTGNIFGDIVKENVDFASFLKSFNSNILTLCLIGKITLTAVILYVLNTKRIFYYFMTLRKIHNEEAKHWIELSPLIFEFSDEPEKFSVIYSRNMDSKYTATTANFIDCIGYGETAEDAKTDLIRRLKCEEVKK